MINLLRRETRGVTDLGWLLSRHTFSFGSYQDPGRMGFRALRVLNDDIVAPAGGFGAHGHRNMEILSYVLSGTLAHRDTMTDERTLGADAIQAMSAGSGVIHSEFNPSPTEPVRFLQIWIEPATAELEPSYQHVAIDRTEKVGRLRLVVAPHHERAPGAAGIHQDARVYAAILRQDDTVDHGVDAGRHAWIQCARGAIEVNGTPFEEGDGAAVSDETRLTIRGAGTGEGELLLFDLA